VCGEKRKRRNSQLPNVKRKGNESEEMKVTKRNESDFFCLDIVVSKAIIENMKIPFKHYTFYIFLRIKMYN
jgi:hypothetical protein